MINRSARELRRSLTSAEIIEAIQTRLARAAPADSQVILFGSRAREDGDDGSDYDILVIERSLARRRAAVRGTLVERALRGDQALRWAEQAVDDRRH